MKNAIVFRDVTSRLGLTNVLHQFNLEIPREGVSVLLGRSGVGKSVMLKHIVGLLVPSSGEIWLGQREISRLSERELLQWRRRCGLIFQHPALLDSLTIEENIALGMFEKSLYKKESRIDHALSLVNLSPTIRTLYPHDLSFGMQKRVSIARAIVLEPEHLLYDEPTTGLDPANVSAINHLIRHLSVELKVTSVVVTHDIDSALQIADLIFLLENGVISFRGTPREFQASAHPTIREFLKDFHHYRMSS